MLNEKENITTKARCKECYAENNRATPLLNPAACLRHHRQYVCNTCGRCICADVDEKGRFRALFPFKSLAIAILYLRAAEVVWQKACGIYEINNDKGGRAYKIFPSKTELTLYLQNNKQKHCLSMQPLFRTPCYVGCKSEQLRMLTSEEVDKYLNERSEVTGERYTK